jgi:hypothetical protein
VTMSSSLKSPSHLTLTSPPSIKLTQFVWETLTRLSLSFR